jgi:hypothetical protein
MSAFTSRLLAASDKPCWQELWARSARFMALHWDWTDHAARGAGQPVRIGVFGKSGKLCAGLTFVARRNRWMTEWRHPAPAAFTGLLYEAGAATESFLRDVFECAAGAVPSEVSRAEVLFQPGLSDVRGLLWAGWEASPHYTYINRVLAPEEFERHIENAARRQAEKARAQGCRALAGIEHLPALLELWGRTCKRQRLAAHVPAEAYRALAGWLSASGVDGLGAEVLLIADAQGHPQAAALLGRDTHRVYYLLGASNPDSLGSGAPTLLQLEALALAHARRWPACYDWVGANTPSIARFKKNFRPEAEVLMLAVRKSAGRRLLEAARKVAG